jgi:hypothetical protein
MINVHRVGRSDGSNRMIIRRQQSLGRSNASSPITPSHDPHDNREESKCTSAHNDTARGDDDFCNGHVKFCFVRHHHAFNRSVGGGPSIHFPTNTNREHASLCTSIFDVSHSHWIKGCVCAKLHALVYLECGWNGSDACVSDGWPLMLLLPSTFKCTNLHWCNQHHRCTVNTLH